ncbi:fungal-specific transcription factor domain-domain-containing protein [Naematelia encephala]|uniref:Fungal-specific transcription factor domain-domain-containing protein n=1 Tax=Naematelia encephala TaxID=71784 RepID=A0A1Y2B0B2_9TREE|nr:fungal-specific transcription factor domain-domain-containing protein [Naematelia encephala]
MGSNAGIDAASESGGGAGYIGLSSGATLLHAIRRLAPQEIVPSPLSNWNAFGLMKPQIPLIPKTGLSSAMDDSQAVLSVGPAKRLPPATEFKPLVDAYFRYFHPLTPIVHEPTVRAQLMGAVPLPRNSGNRVLFYMIFAMGSFDLALTAEDDNGYKYYEIARHAYREEVMEEGSLQLVQGLAIMANYLQRSNKPNAGFVCLGVAIRMAIALGIHASATGGKLTALDSETRTRLWWGLVTLEAGCCSTFGRPHALGFSSLMAVRLPTNCDDESLTVSDETIPPAAQHVTLYTALIIQARLAKTAFGLQDRISKSLPSPRVEQIKWCGQSFQDDLLSFPAFMQTAGPGPYRLARAIQSWRARYLRSVLYRPVLLSAAWSPSWRNGRDKTVHEIVETCRTLALENLRDISDFCRSEADPHRGAEWYFLYFGFQAALTLLLSIVWEPDHASIGTWRSAISETLQWTRQLRSVQQLATSYATIMENVLNAKVPVLPQIIPEPYAGETQDLGQGEACDVAFDFERYLYVLKIGCQANRM